MRKALLLSGRHEGKEVYQLVLPRQWITYMYDKNNPDGESREEFLEVISKEIAGTIRDVYGLESFTLGSKGGVLIIDNQRQEVERINSRALEYKLKELADEVILPLTGDVC